MQQKYPRLNKTDSQRAQHVAVLITPKHGQKASLTLLSAWKDARRFRLSSTKSKRRQAGIKLQEWNLETQIEAGAKSKTLRGRILKLIQPSRTFEKGLQEHGM